MRTMLIKALALLTSFVLSAHAAAQTTVDDANLRTWWHSSHELNATTPVADAAVRRSTLYDTKVATVASPDVQYDSFPYMSIPRGGRDKWGYTDEDGAEFADQANLTMSWTSSSTVPTAGCTSP